MDKAYSKTDILAWKVSKVKEDIKQIKINTPKILSDKSVPLEERWKVYLDVENLLPIDSIYLELSVDGFNKSPEYYDDLYVERYQTISYSGLVERLEEDEKFSSAEYINALKEKILETGQGGCIYDW